MSGRSGLGRPCTRGRADRPLSPRPRAEDGTERGRGPVHPLLTRPGEASARLARRRQAAARRRPPRRRSRSGRPPPHRSEHVDARSAPRRRARGASRPLPRPRTPRALAEQAGLARRRREARRARSRSTRTPTPARDRALRQGARQAAVADVVGAADRSRAHGVANQLDRGAHRLDRDARAARSRGLRAASPAPSRPARARTAPPARLRRPPAAPSPRPVRDPEARRPCRPRGGVDRASLGLVVERDVSADHRDLEGRARIGEPLHRAVELPRRRGASPGLPKLRQLVSPSGSAPTQAQVLRALQDRLDRAPVRVTGNPPAVAVDRRSRSLRRSRRASAPPHRPTPVGARSGTGRSSRTARTPSASRRCWGRRAGRSRTRRVGAAAERDPVAVEPLARAAEGSRSYSGQRVDQRRDRQSPTTSSSREHANRAPCR